MREEFFTRIALCALLGTLAACNDSSGDGSLLAAVASVSGGNPEVSAARIAAAAPVTPRAGLTLSCSTATATVQFAACPNGKLVYAVPAAGVYVESSTVATTTIPGYSAATHVFQPYQNAVAVVICTFFFVARKRQTLAVPSIANVPPVPAVPADELTAV